MALQFYGTMELWHLALWHYGTVELKLCRPLWRYKIWTGACIIKYHFACRLFQKHLYRFYKDPERPKKFSLLFFTVLFYCSTFVVSIRLLLYLIRIIIRIFHSIDICISCCLCNNTYTGLNFIKQPLVRTMYSHVSLLFSYTYFGI